MDEAQAQREALSAEIEREMAGGHLSFPTFLDVSFKIQRTLEQEDFGLDSLLPLIQLEPVLAARLLGLANSALYHSGGAPVRELRHAVLRVGLAAVRSLALVVATSQLTRGERLGAARPYAIRLWDHSVDVAAWAYAIAKETREAIPEEAMLAGMLHDMGQFYLLGKAADYPALLDRETELSDLILCWHKPVGRAVLQALGVPPALVDAVDDTEADSGPVELGGLADVLFVANLAAEMPNPLSLMRESNRQSLLEAATHGWSKARLEALAMAAGDERRRALAVLRL